jgi:hypothetical protein
VHESTGTLLSPRSVSGHAMRPVAVLRLMSKSSQGDLGDQMGL